jgi:hypothetical protein
MTTLDESEANRMLYMLHGGSLASIQTKFYFSLYLFMHANNSLDDLILSHHHSFKPQITLTCPFFS